MNQQDLRNRNFETEFVYSTSRSGGPGGQNVNKVSSKVELRINIVLSTLLNDSEKELILRKLKNKINSENELILVSQSERTQLKNKKAITERFYELVSKALTLPIKRKSTLPTLSSRIRRLEGKKIHSTMKKLRKYTSESE